MLSPLGAIVYVLWHEIPNRIKHVELGDFVVMPNHIYGILIIDEPFIKNNDIIVESGHALIPQQPGKNRFQNIGENTISSIVGGYKSAVTKFANRLELKNGWQSRFNDHIIRDDAEYQRISNYIINNPMKWTADKFSFNK